MKYRHIITSGCSFSEPTRYSWVDQLESYIKKIDPKISFDHRGLSSQGQDLIQKKAAHAIFEALRKGYKPEEIAVFVMWSSIDRKSFYIDNPDMIEDIVQNWKGSIQGWALQFGDFKNKSNNLQQVKTSAPENNNIVYYNKNGGWFITSAHVKDEVSFVKNYFMMGKESISPGLVNDNLENILYLQYLCKSKGIKLYQQFFMDNIIEDLRRHKNHEIVQYLYDDLDLNTFISDKSCYGYLEYNEAHFRTSSRHPNALGHKVWLHEVMLPKLEEDNFFE